MSGDTSAIALPVACVTMIDAREGDAFVVDLRVAKDYKSVKAWNRYIVDTGVPKKIDHEAPELDNTEGGMYGGPRAGLFRAVFDYDILYDRPHDTTLRPPWRSESASGPYETPIVCGMIITHTDADHWGNADWMSRYLSLGVRQFSPSFTLNPLPIYTSPMIEWSRDIAHICEAKVDGAKLQVTTKHNAIWSEAYDKAKTEARRYLAQNFNLTFKADGGRNFPARLSITGELDDDFNDLLLLKSSTWEEALKRFQEKQIQLLTEKPYCSLELGQDSQSGDQTDKRYYIRWVHKKIKRTVRRSFGSIYELANILGYSIQYRFNFQTTLGGKEVTLPNHKDMLMNILSKDWIDAEATSPNYKWSTNPVLWLDKERLHGLNAIPAGSDHPTNEVWVFAELRLVPPNVTAKRSYKVSASDPNVNIAGDWLRLIGKYKFVSGAFDSLEPENGDTNQIPSSTGGIQLRLLNATLQNGQNSNQGGDGVVQNAIMGHANYEWMQEAVSASQGLEENVKCLGLQDKIYGLNFSVGDIPSFWKSTYTGCAGTRFARDFQHLATQYHLHDKAAKLVAKTSLTVERGAFLLLHREQMVKQAKIDVIGQVLGRKGNTKPNDEQTETALESLRKTLRGELDSFLRTFFKREKAPAAKGPVFKKNPAWAQAANRSSLITHFCFDARTNGGDGRPVEFDMLFTGDAFEIGAGESQPYPNHLRPAPKDYQYPLAYKPHTIERNVNSTGNPDGNMLTWLFQNSKFKSLRVGVLKLPHHGSSNTTNAIFYKFVSASVYLVSGAHSPHGHPRPETLQAIISTILSEDGPAKPPSKYLSVETVRRAKASGDANWVGKLKDAKLSCITERPRPRLIFLTYGTCKYERWTKEMRQKKEAEFRTQQKQARDWQSSSPEDEMKVEVPELDDDSEDDLGDDHLIEIPEDPPTTPPPPTTGPKKPPPEPAPVKPKRDRMDVQEFVYFHSRHLGGFGDVPYENYENGKYEPENRANVRIFVQKGPGAATRLAFGFDKQHLDQVRVEWKEEDWFELRADSAPDEAWSDPVAYPLYGELPDWERRAPEAWEHLSGPHAHFDDGGNGGTMPSGSDDYLNLVPGDSEVIPPPGNDVHLDFGEQMMQHPNPAAFLAKNSQSSQIDIEDEGGEETIGEMVTFKGADHQSNFSIQEEDIYKEEYTFELDSATGPISPLNVKRSASAETYDLEDMKMLVDGFKQTFSEK
ncbi:hypothetical protein TWF718_006882 [Orbilia javanica]|uniref:Uncharacterized protein n=1 Tax=Orbilia javanica TaxID=47235 RepID=A0AAN8NV28_9PEZI